MELIHDIYIKIEGMLYGAFVMRGDGYSTKVVKVAQDDSHQVIKERQQIPGGKVDAIRQSHNDLADCISKLHGITLEDAKREVMLKWNHDTAWPFR